MPRITVKLVSTAGIVNYSATTENPKAKTEKMVVRKYDPKIRKHVEYKEAKI